MTTSIFVEKTWHGCLWFKAIFPIFCDLQTSWIDSAFIWMHLCYRSIYPYNAQQSNPLICFYSPFCSKNQKRRTHDEKREDQKLQNRKNVIIQTCTRTLGNHQPTIIVREYEHFISYRGNKIEKIEIDLKVTCRHWLLVARLTWNQTRNEKQQHALPGKEDKLEAAYYQRSPVDKKYQVLL